MPDDDGSEKQQGGKGAISPSKLKISFDQYKRLRNMIVLHVREDQEKVENLEEWEGVKQNDIVDW
jgi:MCM6 C-terminal winged-helix domain